MEVFARELVQSGTSKQWGSLQMFNMRPGAMDVTSHPRLIIKTWMYGQLIGRKIHDDHRLGGKASMATPFLCCIIGANQM
jgi:hypothetical protein